MAYLQIDYGSHCEKSHYVPALDDRQSENAFTYLQVISCSGSYPVILFQAYLHLFCPAVVKLYCNVIHVISLSAWIYPSTYASCLLAFPAELLLHGNFFPMLGRSVFNIVIARQYDKDDKAGRRDGMRRGPYPCLCWWEHAFPYFFVGSHRSAVPAVAMARMGVQSVSVWW